MNRASKERKDIFTDTLKLTRGHGSYKQSELYNEDDVPNFNEINQEHGPIKRFDKTSVKVINDDTLNVALELVKKGDKPLVLNMASDYKGGGGVRSGSAAQEEELFRRTNYDNCCNQKFYPLSPLQFVVTENVFIVKDQDYKPLKDWEQVDFIAMPGVRKPQLSYDQDDNGNTYVDYYHDTERELMETKIDLIFRYAVLEKYDTLVLGALGCGAFANPVKEVAEMFKSYLEKYKGAFKKVYFAVLSRDDNQNYNVFKSVLCEPC